MDDTERALHRAAAVEPGSRQEAEALARLDELRAQDEATYQAQRKRGWDARAGSPRMRPSLDVPA